MKLKQKIYLQEMDKKEEKVVQNGVDGTKEVTYKVKYLNGQETEKVQIAENVIQNPVNCVKEIRNKKGSNSYIKKRCCR